MPTSTLDFNGKFGLLETCQYLLAQDRPVQRSKIGKLVGRQLETRLFELKARPAGATPGETQALETATAQKPQDFASYGQTAAREALDTILADSDPYVDVNKALMLGPKSALALADALRVYGCTPLRQV
jgi:hypothetical protein